jgi:hypothetical protein
MKKERKIMTTYEIIETLLHGKKVAKTTEVHDDIATNEVAQLLSGNFVRIVKKVKYSFNESEWRLLLQAMNKLRNGLIAEGRYTDTVDDIIMKITKAPIRKVKIA